MGRQTNLLIATAAAAGLAACAAEPPSLPSGISSEHIAAGAAYPDSATGPGTQSFNPFAGPSDTAGGGREVIASPTQADVQLTGELPEFSIGRTDAPVTIVKYASLTCPHCRRFHLEVFPQIKKEYIDTGKVRFVIREFPIGKTSGNATIALRCAPLPKYLELYGKFLTQQASWVSQEVRLDPIFAVASQVGMKRAEFDACLKNQGMIDALKWVKERGRKLGVIGTPNFFIGTRLVKSQLGMKEIREMVDPLLTGKAATASVADGQ